MDVTVIIPLHTYNSEYNSFLENAVSSVNETEHTKPQVIIVARKEDFDKYNFNGKNSVTLVSVDSTEDTTFQHLVNKGVKECKTEYFSILEFDDEYTETCFKNFEKYSDSEFASSVMLPLSEIVEFENMDKGSVGYINEAVWANGFSEVQGYLDEKCVSDFFGFNLTGGLFKKDDFLSIGGLKESIKVSFWYEFVLRALKYNKTIFVMPKVGYIHLANRPDSLTNNTKTNISQEEAEWWIELAKKEYFYKDDRKKTYEE